MKEIKTEEQKKAFELGVTYLKGYLMFCGAHPVGNFILKDYEFMKGIMNLSMGSDYIPNSQHLTFSQFCERYSAKDLEMQNIR